MTGTDQTYINNNKINYKDIYYGFATMKLCRTLYMPSVVSYIAAFSSITACGVKLLVY